METFVSITDVIANLFIIGLGIYCTVQIFNERRW